MNADLCDICKLPITGKKSLTGGSNTQYRVKIMKITEGFSMLGHFKDTRHLDICPCCMDRFVRFVDSEVKKDG